ncbi:uroporphyrinogen-III C-methyltransferase [Mesobacillus subterraneus]|uniref:uroporphyrinogen-III C-methyltransferase n=1 Tax=Mesobacillus subterraneus TaxID=285983 RepID=UPI002040BC02|nr:uroporphyrinogen-III C-methyltransferase [Mesobacillus subterraneus]MCM3573544.1 uroporphyrinogen-III C-methyltransferase [Mesobacillus subterraneus]
MEKGRAYLVGAGPGDIQLITVKGMEAIKKAQVILYDRLANPKLLDYAPADCELIYCGKLPDRHVLRQEMINDLLVEKVLEGKIVVRLKGGDPGVFGRVGEEAAALAVNGLSFDIVPGITSGISAPLYAGVPVTHREFGESFAVVTAHDKSENGQPKLNWKGLAIGIDTIAFYMGISNLPYISENLIKHGKPADTPVILIQWGTFSRQQTLEGTLSNIAAKAKEVNFTNPAITLVGNIVSLRKKLNWFEKKPLFGKQILLARTGTDESELAKELMESGADVIEFPKWKKVSVPADQAVIDRIPEYEKILFTSPESVGEFFDILFSEGIDIRRVKADFYGCSTKSVKALNEKGFFAEVDVKMSQAGKLLIVGDSDTAYKYPHVEMFVTSKKVIDEQFTPIFKRILDESSVNTIVLPSSRSVKTMIEEGVLKEIIPQQLLKTAKVVCMGVKTAETAGEYGIATGKVLEVPDKTAVVDCLANKESELAFV